MLVALLIGATLVVVGALLLVFPQPMLDLLDRGYYTRLSPLWRIRSKPHMIERYQSKRRLLRYAIPLATLAVGVAWVGFAAAQL